MSVKWWAELHNINLDYDCRFTAVDRDIQVQGALFS